MKIQYIWLYRLFEKSQVFKRTEWKGVFINSYFYFKVKSHKKPVTFFPTNTLWCYFTFSYLKTKSRSSITYTQGIPVASAWSRTALLFPPLPAGLGQVPGGNSKYRGSWGSATGRLIDPSVPGSPRTCQLLCLALGTRIQKATEVFRHLPPSSPFQSPLVLGLLMV